MKGDQVRVQRLVWLKQGEDGLPHGQAVAELCDALSAEYELVGVNVVTEAPGGSSGRYVLTLEGVHDPREPKGPAPTTPITITCLVQRDGNVDPALAAIQKALLDAGAEAITIVENPAEPPTRKGQ